MIRYLLPLLLFVTPLKADLLKAIGAVETGNDNSKIGRAGERSEFQLTYATWRRYTKKSFYLASTDPVLARQVAAMHLEHLKKVLLERGWDVTSFNLALLWNGGENRRKFLSRQRDYASRVAAMENFLDRRMVAYE